MLTEPLVWIGRPKPFDRPHVRKRDVRAIEIRKVEEFLFHCEVTWRKPGGERGMVLVLAELPQVHKLLKWLDRVANFPSDTVGQLWTAPVSDEPIVNIVIDEP